MSTAELEILPDRGDYNRLGFAILLKLIEIEGCFPSSPREVPAAALSHLASQLRIPPTAFIQYDWTGRAPANAIARASALFSAFGRSVSATLSHCGIGSKLKEICSNQHISALSDGPW